MTYRMGHSPERNKIPWRIVTVDIVDGESVHCIDTSGVPIVVDARIARAKGAKPVVGERWVLDRSVLDQWTFAAVLGPSPAVIEGSRASGGALASLLSALDEMGLVVDQTTP